jgi:hypothetical protein
VPVFLVEAVESRIVLNKGTWPFALFQFRAFKFSYRILNQPMQTIVLDLQ